ncbi:DUF177 domain-containing protein [bacterium]|nr:DUF177 domain-containing protein [bacterium]
MKVKVARVPKSGIILEEEEPPEIMGESLGGVEYKEPVHARISVSLVGRTLVVLGNLTTSAALECNRCLKKFDYRIEVPDYRFTAEVKGDETVDLTESIREGIILNLPMKRLCSPECKGLCPACGRDLNASVCNCKKPEVPGPFSQLDSLKP